MDERSDIPGPGDQNGPSIDEANESTIESSVGGGVKPKESPSPSIEGENILQDSRRLMGEFYAESRRVRTAFFVGTCLFLIVGALLILVAVFYLKLAGKQVGGRLDQAATAIGDRFERRFSTLLDEMDRKDLLLGEEIRAVEGRVGDLVELEVKIQELERQLGNAKRGEMEAKAEFRQAMEAMNRERKNLEVRRRLLDDMLVLLRKEQGGGEEADNRLSEFPGSGSAGESTERDGAFSTSLVLQAVNRVLSDYSEQDLKIMECEWMDAGVLRKPFIRIKEFLDEGPALLAPEVAVFLVEEANTLELKCFGGHYTQPGKKRLTMPAQGVSLVRFTFEPGEEVLTAFMKRMLGLDRPRVTRDVSSPDVPGMGEDPVIDILNRILLEERRGKYRFTVIGGIEKNLLVGVELERYDASGKMENRVVAATCEITLNQRDRYVEFIFKDGFFLSGKTKMPFYNNAYRLPIPDVNNELWTNSGLELIRVQ